MGYGILMVLVAKKKENGLVLKSEKLKLIIAYTYTSL